MSQFGIRIFATMFLTWNLTLAFAAEPRRTSSTQLAGTIQLKVSNGYLSLEANQAPLVQVFEEIARQARIAIHSNIAPEEKITIRLNGVPLEDGIRQLANNESVFYTENPTDKTRRIERVVVLSTGSGVLGQTKVSSQAEKGDQPVPQQAEGSKPVPESFKFELDPRKVGENQKQPKQP